MNQEYEDIKKIIKLTLKAQTNFLDVEARHRDDIKEAEITTYGTSLDHIVFNVKSWESRIKRHRELQETPRLHQCTVAPPGGNHDVARGENQPDLEEYKDSSILPNPNQSTIKEKLRSKIHTSEAILKMITTPSRDIYSAPAVSQVTTHVKYIKRMEKLAKGVTLDLIHIRSNNGNHIHDTELKSLAEAMVHIGHRASINYKDWRVWKDPITKL